ncbi:MAG: hypothetical protein ACTH7N_04765 [Brevibacterium aurantiacum]
MSTHPHSQLDTLQRTAARLEKDTRTGRAPKGRIFDTVIAVTMLRILARLEAGTTGPVDARFRIPEREKERARRIAFARIEHAVAEHGSISAVIRHVTGTIGRYFRARHVAHAA